jgi:hypothetical protein
MDRYADTGIPAPAQAQRSERYVERNTANDDIRRGRESAAETRTSRQAY